VTLVDRLLHRADVIAIDGSSYRLKEAKDRATTGRGRRKERERPDHRHDDHGPSDGAS